MRCDLPGVFKFGTDANDSTCVDIMSLQVLADRASAPPRSEALEQRLRRRPRGLAINLIPTWECNLRCPTCFILGNLERPNPSVSMPMDADGVVKFMTRHAEAYGHESFHVHLIGGEPTLRATECLAALKTIKSAHPRTSVLVTTNFVTEWRDEVQEMLSIVDDVAVSVDGDRRSYELERVPLARGTDPFSVVVRNLDEARRHGLSGKIIVNAATSADFYEDKRRVEVFSAMMKLLGVKAVNVSSRAPSFTGKVSGEYATNMARAKPIFTQCCSFRLMSVMTVFGGDVYGDYYDRKSLVGKLSDQIPELEERHLAYIKSAMPALKDEECLSCPVLAACWGRCINNAKAYGDKPSSMCDQEALVAKVEAMARDKSLLRSVRIAESWPTYPRDIDSPSTDPCAPE